MKDSFAKANQPYLKIKETVFSLGGESRKSGYTLVKFILRWPEAAMHNPMKWKWTWIQSYRITS